MFSTSKVLWLTVFVILTCAVQRTTLAQAATILTNPQPIIIPAVEQWTGGIGFSDVRHASIVAQPSSVIDLKPLAHLFRDDLQNVGAGDSKIVDQAPRRGPYYIFTIAAVTGLSGLAVPDQAYTVDIRNGVVTITASNEAGLYYGTRSILQMLAGSAKHDSLTNGTIVDYPKYHRRMLLLDAGRKPFPYDSLLDYLRMMGWFKFNELHLHLSDEATTYAGFRVQCDTFPGLTSTDCFYTKDQIKELIRIAHLYGITITPEIDMPGHSLKFTNYWPDLRNPKLNPYYMDVTNPDTVIRMKKLLDEMIPLFDAPDFHIGTDEYFVGGSPADQLQFQEAFRQFINTMDTYVRSKGKNTRIWSGYENMLGNTPINSDITIDMWESNDAQAEINAGHNIINSDQSQTYIVPGAHYYGVDNAEVYDRWEPWKMNNDPTKNPNPADPHFLGSKLHVWMDKGPDGYDMTEIAKLLQPSLMAFGEKMWGTKGFADYSTFLPQTAFLFDVPGVTIFNRVQAERQDGVVLSEAGEHSLSQTTDVPLSFYKQPRTDLEWPWTLTMMVKQTSDNGDRAVIMSSNNMEICADYSRTVGVAAKDPITGVTTTIQKPVRGVGLDRAFGAPATDPSLTSMVNDAAGVYTDPLNLGEWENLTVVGEQGYTSVYVNGLLAGRQNNQMLCPLAMLGSPSGHSMTGSVKDVAVYNRAFSSQEVGKLAGLQISGNFAATATTTSSVSDVAHGFTPEKITDSKMDTRWSSGITNDPQWVLIDLGSKQTFNTMNITWEAAFPNLYSLSVSRDRSTWAPVYRGTGKEGLVSASFPSTTARYIKIDMSAPATGWGYSIFDAQVLLITESQPVAKNISTF